MMHFPLTPRRRLLSHFAWALAPATAALALSGCGGVGNTVSARLRAVDAATNAGTTNILVNASGSYGDQKYFNASQYEYLSTGSSDFSALANTQITSVTPPTSQVSHHTLSQDKFYTAYLVGRPDVLPTDNRYLQVHVTDDTKPSIGSGKAAVRVLDAAPDAGSVDVLVNGSAPDPSFQGLTFTNPKDNFLTAPYVLVNAGTLAVTVNATGTSTAIIPATNISVQAGKGYTILVTEPVGGVAATATTPATSSTYAIQTTTE